MIRSMMFVRLRRCEDARIGIRTHSSVFGPSSPSKTRFVILRRRERKQLVPSLRPMKLTSSP